MEMFYLGIGNWLLYLCKMERIKTYIEADSVVSSCSSQNASDESYVGLRGSDSNLPSARSDISGPIALPAPLQLSSRESAHFSLWVMEAF